MSDSENNLEQEPTENDQPTIASEDSSDAEALAAEWAAAMEESGSDGQQDDIDAIMADEKSSGTPVITDSLLDQSPNLEVILDIPVSISMEVGATEITIRNLLQLNQGSVIELDRLAGEPLDVFVNGTLIAHGEVVVVNEKFGIRLTDVASPAERIRRLR